MVDGGDAYLVLDSLEPDLQRVEEIVNFHVEREDIFQPMQVGSFGRRP